MDNGEQFSAFFDARVFVGPVSYALNDGNHTKQMGIAPEGRLLHLGRMANSKAKSRTKLTPGLAPSLFSVSGGSGR